MQLQLVNIKLLTFLQSLQKYIKVRFTGLYTSLLYCHFLLKILLAIQIFCLQYRRNSMEDLRQKGLDEEGGRESLQSIVAVRVLAIMYSLADLHLC